MPSPAPSSGKILTTGTTTSLKPIPPSSSTARRSTDNPLHMDHPYLSEFDLELIRMLSNDLVFLTTRIASQLFPRVPLRTIQHRIHRLLALKYLSRRLFPAF